MRIFLFLSGKNENFKLLRAPTLPLFPRVYAGLPKFPPKPPNSFTSCFKHVGQRGQFRLIKQCQAMSGNVGQFGQFI